MRSNRHHRDWSANRMRHQKTILYALLVSTVMTACGSSHQQEMDLDRSTIASDLALLHTTLSKSTLVTHVGIPRHPKLRDWNAMADSIPKLSVEELAAWKRRLRSALERSWRYEIPRNLEGKKWSSIKPETIVLKAVDAPNYIGLRSIQWNGLLHRRSQ